MKRRSCLILRRGRSIFANEEYKAAEIEFKNSIQLDPEFVDAHFELAETYLKLNDPQRAFQEYSAIDRIEAGNVEASLKLASFYLLAKEFDKASEKVQLVLDKDPERVEAIYLMAGLKEVRGDLDGAQEAYRRIIALDGKQVRAYIGLAKVQGRLGKVSEAEASLQQAKALDPKDTSAWMALISFYSAKKAYGPGRRGVSAGDRGQCWKCRVAYNCKGAFMPSKGATSLRKRHFGRLWSWIRKSVRPFCGVGPFLRRYRG